MSVGLDNLILADEETQQKTYKIGNQGAGGVDTSGRKWRSGELEWEAYMRTIDNAVSFINFLKYIIFFNFERLELFFI